MVDFPIVDTHVHLWDPNHLRYSWLDGIPLLNQRYLLEEYRQACGAVQVEQMVFVQCECDAGQHVQEAEWVSSLARQDGRIRGIVANAPLERGAAVDEDLEVLAAIPLVKGIRRLLQSEDAAFCLQPGFIEGVRLLPSHGLSFDICIFHPQLANAIEFVRQCPDVSFILDHIGKPDIKNQVFDPWKDELKALAAMPNVYCKISGLVTEADMERWTPEDLKPYIDHVIACFGIDRVMYGGDWPVAFQATEYPLWVETLSWATSGLSDAERRKLFHDNAISFYRL